MGKREERGAEKSRVLAIQWLCPTERGEGVPGEALCKAAAYLVSHWVTHHFLTFRADTWNPPPLRTLLYRTTICFFNLSSRPCSFSFSTARLTAFLESDKTYSSDRVSKFETDYVCFVLICFLPFFFPLASVATLVTKKMKWEKATKICNYELRISWNFR